MPSAVSSRDGYCPTFPYPELHPLKPIVAKSPAASPGVVDELRDLRARARVQARIERLAGGNAGDMKPVGEGVSEMRIDYGPGYRVYFTRQKRELIVLLAGGDKSTQAADITGAGASFIFPVMTRWSADYNLSLIHI